jgi:hypothetical protein
LDSFGKRLLAGACAWLVFGLVGARPLRAQNPGTAFAFAGTAGFETGLRLLAYIEPPNGASKTDSGVTVEWGDGTSDMGLAIKQSDGNYNVYGTHVYRQPGTYTVHISYTWDDCPNIFTDCHPKTPADLSTTATITPPGKFVILSIGDSIASGEGNPVVPDNFGNGDESPNWSYWDDPYSDYESSSPDGNPKWTFPCHRSSLAGPAQAAVDLRPVSEFVAGNPGSDITFVHYACSGAKIDAGDTGASWAQDAVDQLRIARAQLAQFGAGIDILLISAGSNSLYGPSSFGNGFGDFVNYCLPNARKAKFKSPIDCDEVSQVTSDLNASFVNIPEEYQDLAMEINCQQPPPFSGEEGLAFQDPDPGCTDPQEQIPKLVLITEYMDVTHDASGQYPPPFPRDAECYTLFKGLDAGEWQFFHDAAEVPLDAEVDSFPGYAQQAGLTVPTYAVTGIASDFLEHGVCSDSNRWLNNGNDSQYLLGEGPHKNAYPGENGVGEQFNGTLHPNSAALAETLGNITSSKPTCPPTCGQEDYANHIVQSAEQYNPPVTTAGATAGGDAYAFGTWTDESVAVSLSATNAISQAGVGATYYAVDGPQCGSSFATQYPANVPGCSVYAGPLTISSNGKHTVTFFSANSAGYPIIAPISMPLQNPPLPCPDPTPNGCGSYQLPPLVPPLEGVLQSVQVWIDRNPTLAASPAFQDVKRGQTATFNVILGHVGWPAGTVVNLSCQTTAPKATCAVIPNSVSIDSFNSAILSVYTNTTASGVVPASPLAPLSPTAALRLLLGLATALLLAATALAMRRRRWSRAGSFAAFAITCGLLFAGCGAAQMGTPDGMYQATVTGVSGGSSHTATVTMLVK